MAQQGVGGAAHRWTNPAWPESVGATENSRGTHPQAHPHSHTNPRSYMDTHTHYQSADLRQSCGSGVKQEWYPHCKGAGREQKAIQEASMLARKGKNKTQC